MFEVPPLCENESDDAPNGSYDLISSFGTYTNQKPHRVSLKKLGWINGVNPLATWLPRYRYTGPVSFQNRTQPRECAWSGRTVRAF